MQLQQVADDARAAQCAIQAVYLHLQLADTVHGAALLSCKGRGVAAADAVPRAVARRARRRSQQLLAAACCCQLPALLVCPWLGVPAAATALLYNRYNLSRLLQLQAIYNTGSAMHKACAAAWHHAAVLRHHKAAAETRWMHRFLSPWLVRVEGAVVEGSERTAGCQLASSSAYALLQPWACAGCCCSSPGGTSSTLRAAQAQQQQQPAGAPCRRTTTGNPANAFKHDHRPVIGPAWPSNAGVQHL